MTGQILSFRAPPPVAGDSRAGASLSRSEVLDRTRLQALAPEIWSDFIRARFRNPEAAAAFFLVRNSTAWNWWNAVNRPSADKVMIAVLELPGFVEHLAALSGCLRGDRTEDAA